MIKVVWNGNTFFLFTKEIDGMTWFIAVDSDYVQIVSSFESLWSAFERIRDRTLEIDNEIKEFERQPTDPPF